MLSLRKSIVFCFAAVICFSKISAGDITFDFEDGKLTGWTQTGTAFKNQPTKGDNSAARGKPAKPQGKFWIGTFENCPEGGKAGEVQNDTPTGTLISDPFTVTKPWASFLVGGGSGAETYVALISCDDNKEIFRASGHESEELRRVGCDLSKYVGKKIQIKIVDNASGPWGHINFDDFQQLEARPSDVAAPLPPSTVGTYAQGLSPADAVKQMKPNDGFTVKLVASEPEINQPVAFCFDERGRIWLLQCNDYPRGKPVGQKGTDKILILEDFDADGHARKVKTFYEGLNLATGLEVGYGGVFVGAAPNLLFIPDKNHDDVPDGEPEVLLSGWGRNDTHELLNSLSWGPDGWLYGCSGVFTQSFVQDIKFTCSIWRYHPTTKKFELFAEGGSNQWGVDWDDYGQAFMTCCVIPHMYHVVPGGLYIRQAGQNANPYAYGAIDTIADHRHYTGNQWNNNDRASSDALGGGHAHCGAMIYLGDTFPPEYRNTILFGNVHGNRINRDILKRSKSGYVASHGPDFMLARDKWFRCTGVKLGPDGSIYASDWYDKQACHHMDDKAWDRSNGRLYKIEYQGTKSAAGIDIGKMSTAELVALQSDKNDWKVRMARKILAERQDKAAIAPLKELALNGPTQEVRLRGLWALYTLGGFDESLGLQLLEQPHSWVRVWAVRFLGESGKISDSAMSHLIELAQKDSAAEVRSQLASSCQKLKGNDTLPLLHALMKHGEDAGDQNIPLLLWIAYESRLLADSKRAVDFLMTEGATSDLARDYILPRVIKRLSATGEVAQLSNALDILSRAPNVEMKRVALRGLLEGLKGRSKMKAPENWAATSTALKQSLTSDEDNRLLMRLASQFDDPAATKQLLETISNVQLVPSVRLEAMSTLSEVKETSAIPALVEIVSNSQTDEIRRGALRALGALGAAEAVPTALKAWPTLSTALKIDALDLLCGRKEWACELLRAVVDKKISQRDISETAVRRMREMKDPELTALLEKSWGRMREKTPDDVKANIEKYRKIVADGQGDAKNGAKMFEKTCMQCHSIFGKGNSVGPELTGSGRKDLNYLLLNVIDPNAVIGAAYYVWTIKMKDGRVVTGIIAEQNDATVTLKRENNAQDVLQRSEIASMKEQQISLMPEGMPDAMQPQEFRDLVKFLQGDGWPQ